MSLSYNCVVSYSELAWSATRTIKTVLGQYAGPDRCAGVVMSALQGSSQGSSSRAANSLHYSPPKTIRGLLPIKGVLSDTTQDADPATE